MKPNRLNFELIEDLKPGNDHGLQKGIAPPEVRRWLGSPTYVVYRRTFGLPDGRDEASVSSTHGRREGASPSNALGQLHSMS